MEKSLDFPRVHNQFIRSYLQSLDCPRSLTVWLLYKNNEHEQLVDLVFDPLAYENMFLARDSLAATEFLSKAKFLNLSRDKKVIAMEKFFASEQSCKESNRRILDSDWKSSLTRAVLLIAQRKISYILGEFPCADDFVDACGWGPGATTTINRRNATKPNKFDLEGRITLEAYDFVKDWFRLAYPHWEVKFEPKGSFAKIVTVPKNAKTDRTIAIEPGLNLWFQKGLGKIIRKRLRDSGLDLKHGQRHNQSLCRLGSKFGHLATIDFSAASDTISKEVVRRLLPSRWFTMLNCFRTGVAQYDGKPILLEKFSSMGNGFTFELETLIFYSIALAVCELQGVKSIVSVYGDDVILPSDVASVYTEVCSDLGFTVNQKKSYSSTGYRESCGSHYILGLDSKPFYLKEILSGKAEILKAANSVRRLSHRHNSYGCDKRFWSCWHILVHALGPNTPRISDGYGDLGLIENIDGPGVRFSRPRNGHEGFCVRVYAPLAVTYKCESIGLLLHKYQELNDRPADFNYFDISKPLTDMGTGNNVSMPLRTRTARIRLTFPRWYDLGPWL